jgi:hypothetical protein
MIQMIQQSTGSSIENQKMCSAQEGWQPKDFFFQIDEERVSWCNWGWSWAKKGCISTKVQPEKNARRKINIDWTALHIRVARWYIFKPKISVWVNFGVSCNERFWKILCWFGLFYCHLVYFWSYWYIFPRFGMLQQNQSGNPVAHADSTSVHT